MENTNNKVNEKSKIAQLIEANEPVANKVIARILLVMSAFYFLVAILTFANVFKANRWVSFGTFSFAIAFVGIALYCLLVKSNAGWIKYVQILLLLISLFLINVAIGYKIWMLFLVPIVLSVRFYNRKFTVTIGIVSLILVIASAYTNSYLAPALGIMDLNLVSFKEPGTLTYYSWLFNAVINHGYDKSRVVINGLRLSVFPNCVAIVVTSIVCNSIISNAVKMLISISDSFEKEIKLLKESHMDELTDIYNRRAYEEDLDEISQKGFDKDLVYISIDVNGLKKVNDNLGHVAGDEIIVATAKNALKVYGPYGKIYRIGGDEFAAILNADEAKLEELKAEFENVVSSWKGKLVDKLAVSCGFVTMSDIGENDTINTITLLADKRMYEAKSKYYVSQGLDRRRV